MIMPPDEVEGLTPSKLQVRTPYTPPSQPHQPFPFKTRTTDASQPQSTIWIVTALAITFVVLRFAIRLLLVKKTTTVDNVLISDLLVFLALATLVAMAGLYVQITPTMFDLDLYAAGRPLLSPDETKAELVERANRYLRVQFGIIGLFWTCVWAVKLSILVFYKSLFDRLSRTYWYAWWAVVAFVALSYAGCWVFQLESCSPLRHYFHIGTEKKKGTHASPFFLPPFSSFFLFLLKTDTRARPM